MNFDKSYIGRQGLGLQERSAVQAGAGSRFAELRDVLFKNAYYQIWGSRGEPALPVYDVTLSRCLRGLLTGLKSWRFLQASRRAVTSRADLRWGEDGRGFRRLLHPNGVCLFGVWEIDDDLQNTSYTGYFQAGSRGLVVGRYSACCTETRRGRYRSLSLVGKLFPTADPGHLEPLRSASFITQEDLGGSRSRSIDEVELRNAPDTTPWRRGRALPVLLLTGLAFRMANPQITIRQLYEIAELGKSRDEPTRTPAFIRLLADPDPTPPGKADPDLDFRDEILGRIYDPGDPAPKRSLTFHIEVSDTGRLHGRFIQRWDIRNWKRIGRIVFNEAVASYNGDFVVHFPHPPWRDDRDDALTVHVP